MAGKTQELIDMAMRLFRIASPAGFDPQEIEAAREKFAGLPAALEAVYRTLGACSELDTQDELRLPYTGYEYLVFYDENQGVCQAGIAPADIHLDDPPVWVTCDIDDPSQWVKAADSLTGFLRAMFGYQAACWGLAFSVEGIVVIEEEDVKTVKGQISQLPDSLVAWLGLEKIELYANSPDERVALIYTGDEVQMLYSANNQDSFEALEAILGGLGIFL